MSSTRERLMDEVDTLRRERDKLREDLAAQKRSYEALFAIALEALHQRDDFKDTLDAIRKALS